MPASVQNAAPSTVMPASLSCAFSHSREYPVAVNEFTDGGAQRGLLANTSRKRWRLAKRLAPAKMAELGAFCGARKGAHQAFYFCDPYQTNPRFSYDPTGTAVQGRYTVRFEGGWSQAMSLGRGDVEIQLVEPAPDRVRRGRRTIAASTSPSRSPPEARH
jgi:phage-related protein